MELFRIIMTYTYQLLCESHKRPVQQMTFLRPCEVKKSPTILSQISQQPVIIFLCTYMAYILHLIDSCVFSSCICFCGRLYFQKMIIFLAGDYFYNCPFTHKSQSCREAFQLKQSSWTSGFDSGFPHERPALNPWGHRQEYLGVLMAGSYAATVVTPR